MRTITSLCLTVFFSMAVSVFGLYVIRALVPSEYVIPSNDVCGAYLQTVGTIYAVLLAFVVFVVWTQANDVRRLIERQADELADLLRITKSFKGSAPSKVRTEARAYVREVVDNEWPLLTTGNSSPKAQELLEQIWKALAAIEPESAREEVLLSEAVSRFSEFGDARADLLHCSRVRLPVLLWLLLLSGAVGTIGSMYMFGAKEFLPVAAMTASLAGAVSFMLFLIRDLDNPFQGDWHVSPKLIVDALGPTGTQE